MKKALRILLLVLVACTSVLFASCDSVYSKLSFKIFDNDVEIKADDIVSLTIDPTDVSKASKDLTVTLSGLGKKANHDIVAYTVPTELANVSARSIADDRVTLTITAVNGGAGQLIVKSAGDSSKQTSRPIIIEKKVQSISTGDKTNYLLMLTRGKNTFEIPNNAFRILPQGATDEIEYRFYGSHDGASLEGNVLTVESTTRESRLIIYATANNKNVDGTSFITVDLIVRPESITIQTNRSNSSRVLENLASTDKSVVTSKLTLVSNAIDKVGSSNYTDTYFNQVVVNALAKYNGSTQLQKLPADFNISAYIYTLINGNKVRNDVVAEIVPNGDSSFVITALANTSAGSTKTYLHIDIIIAGHENEYVNEFALDDIEFEVISAPTDFVVKADGEALELENETGVDGNPIKNQFVTTNILYDSYSYAYGSRYNVSILPSNSALTDYFGYRLRVKTNLLTDKNLYGATLGNKYSLVLTNMVGEYISFVEMGNSEYAISSTISKDDLFFVKYQINAGDFDVIRNLELYIETDNTLYDTNNKTVFEYLPNVSLNIRFDIRRGVTEMTFVENDNKANGVIILNINEMSYPTVDLHVLNVDGQVTTDIGLKECLITISTDSDAIMLLKNGKEGRSFDYEGSAGENIISIVPKDVGEYTITARSDNGIVTKLKIFVYEPFDRDKVEIDDPTLIYGSLQSVTDETHFDVAVNSRLKFGYKLTDKNAKFRSQVSYGLASGGANVVEATITESGVFDALYATHSTNFVDDKRYISVKVEVAGATSYEETDNGFQVKDYVAKSKTYYIFIYTPIRSFNLDRYTATAYDANTLGYYNRDKAQLSFQATIYPANAYLDAPLVWETSSSKILARQISIANQTATYEFSLPEQSEDVTTSSKINVYASVKQYGREFKAVCEVTVSKVTQSQNIIFEQGFKTTQVDAKRLKTLTFKASNGLNTELDLDNINVDNCVNTKTILASVYPYNKVFDKEMLYFICKNSLTATDKKVTDIAVLSGNTIIPVGAGCVSVIVVPRDALMGAYSAGDGGLDSIVRRNPTTNKPIYEEIIIKVEDGSTENPYSLQSVQDVVNINNIEGLKSHYVLLNDIDFNGRAITPLGIIGNQTYQFTGSINGLGYGIYNVGLTEKNGYTGLFAIIGEKQSDDRIPTIQNTGFSFVLDKDNDRLEGSKYYGGLAGLNYGFIDNCTFKLTGRFNAQLNNAIVSLGAITGVNYGTINLSNKNVGVENTLVLNITDAEQTQAQYDTYFGGVVGLNYGQIFGYYMSQSDFEGFKAQNNITADSELTFETMANFTIAYESNLDNMYGNEGMTAVVDVVANINTVSKMAFGALVGKNHAFIVGAITTGRITGIKNIGGLVGENNGGTLIYSFANVDISANNTIAGVTAVDMNGVYYHVNSEYYFNEDNDSQISQKYANLQGYNNIAGFIAKATGSAISYSYVASYKGILQGKKWSYDNYYADIVLLENTSTDAKNVAGFIAVADGVTVQNSTASVSIVVQNQAPTEATKVNVSTFIATLDAHLTEMVNGYVKGKIHLEQTMSGNAEFSLNGITSAHTGDGGIAIEFVYTMVEFDYSTLIGEVHNHISALDISGEYYYIDVNTNAIYNGNNDEVDNMELNDAFVGKTQLDDDTHFIHDDNNLVNNGFPILRTVKNADNDTALGEEAVSNIDVVLNTSNILYVGASNKPVRAHKLADDSVILTRYNLQNLIAKSETDRADSYYLGYDSARINSFKINDIISTTVTPASTRTKSVIVKSSNEQIVKVSNGTIVLVGNGQVKLKVMSKLNNSVFKEIHIFVENAVDNFELYQNTNFSSGTSKLTNTLNIGVKKSKNIIPRFSEQLKLDANDTSAYYGNNDLLIYGTDQDTISNEYRSYAYAKNSNAGVMYLIRNNSEKLNEYLTINGLAWQTIIYNGISYYMVRVENNSQAVIEAGKMYLNHDGIEIIALPYIRVGTTSYEYCLLDSLARTFTVNTYNGATAIHSSANSRTISPLNTATVTITVNTDFNGDDVVLMQDNDEIVFNADNVYAGIGDFTIEKKVIQYGSYDDPYMIVEYTFRPTEKVVTSTKTWQFSAYAKTDRSLDPAVYSLTLCPQEVLHLAIDNYYSVVREYLDATTGATEYDYQERQTDKVIPGQTTLLKVNVYPSFADYDYIEVINNSSLKVVMQQVLYDTSWHNDRPSPYRLTKFEPIYTNNSIRLYKSVINASGQEETVDIIDQYYVRMTLASSVAENTVYAMSVKAYKVVDGQRVDVTGDLNASINLVVQNLPTTSMTYTDSLGKEYYSSQNMTETINIANGVNFDVAYKISTTDADVSFNVVNGDGVVIDNGVVISERANSLHITFNTPLAVNDSFFIRATSKKIINGSEYETKTYLGFKVRMFVVNGISIVNSRDGIISGRYGESYELQATFGDNDIVVADGIDILSHKTDLLNRINTKWQIRNDVDAYQDIIVGSIYNIAFDRLSAGWLFMTSNSEINVCTARVSALIEYDEDGIPQVLDIETADSVVIEGETGFSFSLVDSLETMIPISTQTEFESMTQDRSYILMNDLTLRNYKPIDANMNQFNGNSYTITIENYDIESYFGENTTLGSLDLGLFKTVSANTIVSNVILNLPQTSLDIKNVITFNYGGIAVTNAGMITNCVVKAESISEKTLTPTRGFISENLFIASENRNNNGLYFYQSSLNTSGEVTTVTNVNFGGLVCNNSGFITNSKVLHSIVGFGNIAGFVYSNTGVIASSKYQYGVIKNQSDQTSDFMTAGFAISNSGTIRTSYAEGEYYNSPTGIETYDQYLRSMLGGIACEVDATGFVFNNTGKVEDCYSDMYIRSNGIISGFVFNNTGTITRAFSTSSFITSEVFAPFVGIDEKTREPLSAPENLIDCYYLVSDNTPDVNELAQPLYVNSSAGEYVSSVQKYSSSVRDIITKTTEIKSADGKVNNFEKEFGKETTKLSAMVEDNYLHFLFDKKVNNIYTLNGSWRMSATYANATEYVKPKLIDADRIFLTRQKALSSTMGDDGEMVYNYGTDTASGMGTIYGTLNNPYLIYDANSFEKYMNINPMIDNIGGAYRLIKDIDLSSLGTKPVTTSKTFTGSIDGNGMTISGLTIYADNESQDYKTSMGLFKEITTSNSSNEQQFLKNFILKPNNIYASHTECVGSLAGIMTGARVSNIDVNSQGSVVLGANVVGGIFGAMYGNFDAQGLKCNMTINSVYRNKTSSRYTIYARTTTDRNMTNNISQVSYAGAIAGLADGYSSGNEAVNNYLLKDRIVSRVERLKYIQPYGEIVVLGENVGFAFGYLSESTQATLMSYEVGANSQLRGVMNSGGLVGENRGVIKDSLVTYADDILTAISNQSVKTERTYGLMNGSVEIYEKVNTPIEAEKQNYSTRVLQGYEYQDEYNGNSFVSYYERVVKDDTTLDFQPAVETITQDSFVNNLTKKTAYYIEVDGDMIIAPTNRLIEGMQYYIKTEDGYIAQSVTQEQLYEAQKGYYTPVYIYTKLTAEDELDLSKTYYVQRTVSSINREQKSSLYASFDLTKTSANLTIFAGKNNSGGIVGFNNGGLVQYSYSTIAVLANNSDTAGGIVGLGTAGGLDHTITTSSVYSNWSIGGLIGKIINPYALSNANSASNLIEYNDNISMSLAGYRPNANQDTIGINTMENIIMSNNIADNLWESRLVSQIFNSNMVQHNSRTGSSRSWANSGTPTTRLIGGLVGCTQRLNVYKQDGTNYLANDSMNDNLNISNNIYNDYIALTAYKQFNRSDLATSVRIAVRIGAMHSTYDGNYQINDYMDNSLQDGLSNSIWKVTNTNKQWSFDSIVPKS